MGPVSLIKVGESEAISWSESAGRGGGEAGFGTFLNEAPCEILPLPRKDSAA